MFGFRRAEVVCLLASMLDCLYNSCCRLSFSFLSFGLRMKGSFLFIIYYDLHENRSCLCLLKSVCAFLTIPSPLNKHEMWHYYVPDFT